MNSSVKQHVILFGFREVELKNTESSPAESVMLFSCKWKDKPAEVRVTVHKQLLTFEYKKLNELYWEYLAELYS